jgi:hypothetical protein
MGQRFTHEVSDGVCIVGVLPYLLLLFGLKGWVDFSFELFDGIFDSFHFGFF